jgi:hypothetical protein
VNPHVLAEIVGIGSRQAIVTTHSADGLRDRTEVGLVGIGIHGGPMVNRSADKRKTPPVQN